MSYYRAGEVLEKAIEIEEKGAAFYLALANESDQEEIKNLFLYLAEQEQDHRKAFAKLQSRSSDFRSTFSWDYYDYMAGMQLLADKGIFEEGSFTVKQAVLSRSKEELIEIAIQFEKDSILYYSEMRPIVDAEAGKILDELIQQERNHIIKLQKLQ